MSAKERKRKIQARSKEAVSKSKGRRSSRVVRYVDMRRKTKQADIHPSYVPAMRQPKEQMSAGARFSILRPDCIHPWDWGQLFTSDEELWPFIVEEAIASVETGELTRYPDDAPANVSRRKLQAIVEGRQTRGEL